MDDYLSKTAQLQRNRYDPNKFIEYLDSENLFEVNFVTLSAFSWYRPCCKLIRECWHAAQLGQKILGKMTDHKVSDFVTKESYHAVPLVSMCTISKPHQIQWVWIQLLLGTDALKHELCVYPPALFGLLTPCCNLTNHPKQMPYRDEQHNLQEFKSFRMWVTSKMDVLWYTKFHGKMGGLMGQCVESILSMSKKKFCLVSTQMVLLQKTILIWDGRNHLAVISYSK